MKWHTFTATYTGTPFDEQSRKGKYVWSFVRCPKSKYWMLKDYTGYIRILEKTWIDSVPRIHNILDNHGMTASIS